MPRRQLLALVLIVAGVLGLVYQRCTYTKETHDLDIGKLHVAVQDKETIDIPLWLSLGAVGAGAVLLLGRKRPA